MIVPIGMADAAAASGIAVTLCIDEQNGLPLRLRQSPDLRQHLGGQDTRSISRAPSIVSASAASTKPPPSRNPARAISLSQIERRIENSQRSSRVPGVN